jgi:hypothetical protein
MDINKEELEKVKKIRTDLLIGLWNYFVEIKYFDNKEINISLPDVNKIVEHYCTDYTVLKYRYKIEGKIEGAKIAGLMASLIVRYRPFHLIKQEYETAEAFYCNEIIAIIYGLAVCFEDSLTEAVKLLNEDWFQEWFDSFKYLLHERHTTSESLAFVYKTLVILLKKK